METVENIMITEVVDGMILNNLADKMATEVKLFKHLKQAYPKLAAEDRAYFLMTKSFNRNRYQYNQME